MTLGLGAAPTSTCVRGGAPTLAWSFTSRPPGSGAVLSDPSSATPSFTADVPGTYATQLVVTDSGGFSTVYRTNVSAGSCTPPQS